MRVSKNKDKIIDILKGANKSVNVQYIYDMLNKENDFEKNDISKKNKVNLSTVYRCINSLCKENIISKEIRNDKNAYYTLNNNSHIHELTCDICKKTILLDECPITTISKQIKDKTGFNITNHSVCLNGICKKCSKK